MKAIYIANYGALDEVVQMGDLPNPAVGPQDVLIQVLRRRREPDRLEDRRGLYEGPYSPRPAGNPWQ